MRRRKRGYTCTVFQRPRLNSHRVNRPTAVSETNTYDDGMSKWDFKGRNAFYTELELKSK